MQPLLARVNSESWKVLLSSNFTEIIMKGQNIKKKKKISESQKYTGRNDPFRKNAPVFQLAGRNGHV